MKSLHNAAQVGTLSHWLSRYRLFLLFVVALALVWLNLGANSNTTLVSPVVRSLRNPISVNTDSSQAGAQAIGPSTNYLQIDRPMLEINDADPFAPEIPKSAARVQPTLPQALPPVVVAEPGPPEPPPLNLLYAGRLTSPDGTLVVYATLGELSLALTPGLELPNGYRVTKVTSRAVEFSYAALNRTAKLEIPPAQKYETR